MFGNGDVEAFLIKEIREKDEVIKYMLHYIDWLGIQLNYEYGNIDDENFKDLTEEYINNFPKISSGAIKILKDNDIFMS